MAKLGLSSPQPFHHSALHKPLLHSVNPLMSPPLISLSLTQSFLSSALPSSSPSSHQPVLYPSTVSLALPSLSLSWPQPFVHSILPLNSPSFTQSCHPFSSVLSSLRISAKLDLPLHCSILSVFHYPFPSVSAYQSHSPFSALSSSIPSLLLFSFPPEYPFPPSWPLPSLGLSSYHTVSSVCHSSAIFQMPLSNPTFNPPALSLLVFSSFYCQPFSPSGLPLFRPPSPLSSLLSVILPSVFCSSWSYLYRQGPSSPHFFLPSALRSLIFSSGTLSFPQPILASALPTFIPPSPLPTSLELSVPLSLSYIIHSCFRIPTLSSLSLFPHSPQLCFLLFMPPLLPSSPPPLLPSSPPPLNIPYTRSSSANLTSLILVIFIKFCCIFRHICLFILLFAFFVTFFNCFPRNLNFLLMNTHLNTYITLIKAVTCMVLAG